MSLDFPARLAALKARHGHLDGTELLAAMQGAFPGKLAVISSFGIEAAVLLDLVAQTDPSLPVVFLDTGELFDETLDYQRALAERLGLRDVRIVRPTAEETQAARELWQTDADSCCDLRKTRPMERAIEGFEALVDGRKRYHGDGREQIATIEAGEGDIVKISPLARWSQERIEAAFAERNLPRHPLAAEGYRSIGCWPCSRPTGPDEPVRAGRWAGSAKTECGIHRVKKADE